MNKDRARAIKDTSVMPNTEPKVVIVHKISLKGYSLMVEQWSSKPFAWVRILLPLMTNPHFSSIAVITPYHNIKSANRAPLTSFGQSLRKKYNKVLQPQSLRFWAFSRMLLIYQRRSSSASRSAKLTDRLFRLNKLRIKSKSSGWWASGPVFNSPAIELKPSPKLPSFKKKVLLDYDSKYEIYSHFTKQRTTSLLPLPTTRTESWQSNCKLSTKIGYSKTKNSERNLRLRLNRVHKIKVFTWKVKLRLLKYKIYKFMNMFRLFTINSGGSSSVVKPKSSRQEFFSHSVLRRWKIVRTVKSCLYLSRRLSRKVGKLRWKSSRISRRFRNLPYRIDQSTATSENAQRLILDKETGNVGSITAFNVLSQILTHYSRSAVSAPTWSITSTFVPYLPSNLLAKALMNLNLLKTFVTTAVVKRFSPFQKFHERSTNYGFDSLTYNLTRYFSTLKVLRESNLWSLTSNVKSLLFKKNFHEIRVFSKKNFGRWFSATTTDFLEHCSGKKTLVYTYFTLIFSLSYHFTILYSRWARRLRYFSRRLGHRFFLRESLHIIHIGINWRDSHIVISWLKSLILRISFWKTRVILRFIRQLFTYLMAGKFPALGAKGFKVKLKGKISVAGNSRKRTIFLRYGRNSHGTVSLRCLYSRDIVESFTGVMGLQLWVFFKC